MKKELYIIGNTSRIKIDPQLKIFMIIFQG